MIIDEFESYSYDRNRDMILGIKQGVVWGKHKITNNIFPLLYISKPANISLEDYEDLLSRIEIIIKTK